MWVYIVLILLCYLSMIVYRELFSRKTMTAKYAIVPSCLIAVYVIYSFTNINKIFSVWIYPTWFFALHSHIQIYLFLMIPMFFGAVYIENRRKAWSAMIFPGIVALFIAAWLGGGLFYEMGWLVFYMILFYLTWGVVCVKSPRFVWAGYVKLRDKSGGRILPGIVIGIIAAVFVVSICVIIFTIAANKDKIESDYIPPLTPPVTTEAFITENTDV